MIGPQVFRFEYCYLLSANGSLSITPPSDISGIAAIVVDIAVIDPKSKVLLTNTQIARSLAGQLSDYAANMVPGQLRNNWQNTTQRKYDLAAPGAFRCSTVRTLFLPLSAYSMIASPLTFSKRFGGRIMQCSLHACHRIAVRARSPLTILTP